MVEGKTASRNAPENHAKGEGKAEEWGPVVATSRVPVGAVPAEWGRAGEVCPFPAVRELGSTHWAKAGCVQAPEVDQL